MAKVEDYHKKMFRVLWQDEDRSTLCEDCLDRHLEMHPEEVVDYFEDMDAAMFGDIAECDVCGHEENYGTEEEEED